MEAKRYRPKIGDVARVVAHPYPEKPGCIGLVGIVYDVVLGSGQFQEGYPYSFDYVGFSSILSNGHWLCECEQLSEPEEAAWRLSGE